MLQIGCVYVQYNTCRASSHFLTSRLSARLLSNGFARNLESLPVSRLALALASISGQNCAFSGGKLFWRRKRRNKPSLINKMPVSVQQASNAVLTCQTTGNPPESRGQDDRNTTFDAESPQAEEKESEEEQKDMEVQLFAQFYL